MVHCEGRAPLKKVYSIFFNPLRPFKLKKHEWLVNSKISTGPYSGAWIINFLVHNFIKKRLQQGCFLMRVVRFLRRVFFYRTPLVAVSV